MTENYEGRVRVLILVYWSFNRSYIPKYSLEGWAQLHCNCSAKFPKKKHFDMAGSGEKVATHLKPS